MDKIVKQIQLALLGVILVSTIVAVGLEVKAMFTLQTVGLADLF